MNITNRIKNFNRNTWNLAFIEQQDWDSFLQGYHKKVHWMKNPYTDRWFADPYILDVNSEEIICIVEEMSYDNSRGRIAKLIIDRKTYELQECKIILDLNTHLSFPFIFRKEKEILIMPENSASGACNIYKYNPKDDALTLFAEISAEPMVDAIILPEPLFGKSYIFSTLSTSPNGNVLSVFEFNTDSMKATKLNDIVFKSDIARNAGGIFIYDGKLYRPAQDCSSSYGGGVILQEMTFDSTTKSFSFIDRWKIYPFSFRYNLGLHTFNCYRDLLVIDGRGYKYPILGRLIRPIINKFK